MAAHSTRGTWREVAASVDAEVMRFDKFQSTVGNTVLYVTGELVIVVILININIVVGNTVRMWM